MEKIRLYSGALVLLIILIIAQMVYIFHLRSRIKYEEAVKEYDFVKFNPSIKIPDIFWNNNNNDFYNNWNPFAEIERMQKRIDKILKNSYRLNILNKKNVKSFFEPDIDIKETPEEYIIRLDLPGMDKDKINIEIRGRTLIISGERKLEKIEKNEHFFRKERSFGYFSRSIPIPEDSDISKINAKYKKGVLTIRIKKAKINKKKSKRKKIFITQKNIGALNV